MPAPASPPAPASAPVSAPAPAVMQSQTAEGDIPMPARTSRRSRIVSVEPSAAETPKIETHKTEIHKTEETVQARHIIEEEQEEQNPQQLLSSILRELQNIRRLETRSEFSIARLLAGLLQVVVFFCLLVSIWLTMETSRRSDLILITLGFATVLQLMALTLYLMHNRK
jgi:hypothetical protein